MASISSPKKSMRTGNRSRVERGQNAASARDLSGLLNKRRGFVPVVGDPLQELILGQPVADSEHPDRRLEAHPAA